MVDGCQRGRMGFKRSVVVFAPLGLSGPAKPTRSFGRGSNMTPNLDEDRVERAAEAMAAKRAELVHAPLARIYDELARAAITAYQGDTHVVVPLDLVRRVTSIARRNEDAPEIHELSAMLSPTPAGKER